MYTWRRIWLARRRRLLLEGGAGAAAPTGPDLDNMTLQGEVNIDSVSAAPYSLWVADIDAGEGQGHGNEIVTFSTNTSTGTRRWQLGTAGDLASGITSVSTQNAAGQGGRGGFISPDGDWLYTAWRNASNPDGVFGWPLSTNFDITTNGARDDLDITTNGGLTDPAGIHMSPDGVYLYVVDEGDNAIYQYTCSTPYVIDTGSGTYTTSFVPTDDTNVRDVTFASDGLYMYTLDAGADVVRRYELSTAWDLDTASNTGESLDVATGVTGTNPYGCHLANDNDLYVIYQTGPEYIAHFSATPTDEHWDKVVLLIQNNGELDGSTTWTDQGPLGLTITGEAGSGSAPQWDDAQSKFGNSAIHFDGTGMNLSVDLTTQFAAVDLGQADFTVEAWIRCATTAGADQMFAFQPSGNMHLACLVSNNSLFIERSTNGTTYTQTDSVHNVVDATWHHIAIVKNNGVITLYMDGVAGATTVTGVLDEILHTLDSSAKIHIGDDNSATNGFDGWMDGFRLTKGVARYTANFTPPIAKFPTTGPTITDPHFANVKLLLDFAGTHGATSTTDLSNDARAVTFVADAQVTVAENHFADNSVLLDGTGDYVTVPDAATWNFAGAFTIEGWFKTDANATAQVLLSQRDTSNGLQVYYNGTTDITVSIGGTAIVTTSDPVFTDDTWYHVALTRDDSNNWNVWLNGTSIGSATDATSIGDSTSPFTIGARADTGAAPWVGNVTGVRVTDGVARYTSTFTPSRRSWPTS